MNRKEFERYLINYADKVWLEDDFKMSLQAELLWQAIEQYGTEQRIDELSLLLESGSISPSNSVNELFRNRIKELKND
ncbi:hypothetical protein LCGC14_2193490 [marine sediment metagenome]|uniref:Uncharacterized protein n=1 Tax=marine sediment metagenome TaxID=412755 RepID=A0A0F9GEK5_9ZZZZ